MPAEITRNIYLKVLKYASGRQKEFEPTPIHKLLSDIRTRGLKIGERIFPEPGVNPEKLHCFFNNLKPHAREGVSFQFFSYIPGHVPVHMRPDPEADNVDLHMTPMTDPTTGKQMELVTVTHVLALGSVLFIEGVRGGGGIAALGSYLTSLVRRYEKPGYPRLRLLDVVSADLLEAIRRGGGAKEVIMDLAHPTGQDAGKFARLLGQVRSSISNTKLVRVRFTSTDTIADEDILKAYEEAEMEDGLDGVKVVLKNHDVIRGFDKYRVRKQVKVRSDGGGVPNSEALVREMRIYLTELQTPEDGVRVITDDGNIVADQVSAKK